LAALRQRYPSSKLWAVFEPRSATACRRLHQAAYASAFESADEVLIAPLGRQNLALDERLDIERLVADLRNRGQQAEAPNSLEGIVAQLVMRAKPGDCIALLSNGRFGGIHEQLLRQLGAE
jgi:UDP-N-acetylmuramate: L-alanyl-gamma-D-glutamyl-meso-diaminopimelate ligase